MKNNKLKKIYIGVGILFAVLLILSIISSSSNKNQNQNNNNISTAPTLEIKNNISSSITEFNTKFTNPQFPSELSTYKVTSLSDDSLKKIATNLNLLTKEEDKDLSVIKYSDANGNYISYQQVTQDFLLYNASKKELSGYTEQNLLNKLALDLSYDFANYKFQSVKDLLGTDQKLYSYSINIKSYKLFRDYGQDFVLVIYIDKSGVLKKVEWKYFDVIEDQKYSPKSLESVLKNFNTESKGVYPNQKSATQISIETLSSVNTFTGKIDANSVEISYVWSNVQNLAIPVYVFNCTFTDSAGIKSSGTVIVPAI